MSLTSIINSQDFLKKIPAERFSSKFLIMNGKFHNISLSNAGYLKENKKEDTMFQFEDSLSFYPSVYGRVFHLYAMLRVIREVGIEKCNAIEFLNNRFVKYPVYIRDSFFAKRVREKQNTLNEYLEGKLDIKKHESLESLYDSLVFFSVLSDNILYDFHYYTVDFDKINFEKTVFRI